ncbi:MAG: choice-of-anchor L domain-containing protein [Pseudomonadota bacterium]
MKYLASAAASLVALKAAGFANTVVTPFDPGVSPVEDLINAFLGTNSGLTYVAGSGSYQGIADQGGTYNDFLLSGEGVPTLQLNDGIVLSTGLADVPAANTDTSYEGQFPGTGGNANLSQLLTDNSAPSSTTNDANTLSFDVTIDDPTATNAIETSFIFGTDEFPDQGVTDAFAFFVDGVNFAEFADGSLITFVEGANNFQFNDNTDDPYGYEMDGITPVLNLVGLFDDSLSTHTIEIVIADTSDTIFDSIVYLESLAGTFTTGGGGTTVDGPIPVPAAGLLMLPVAGFFAARRKKRAA